MTPSQPLPASTTSPDPGTSTSATALTAPGGNGRTSAPAPSAEAPASESVDRPGRPRRKPLLLGLIGSVLMAIGGFGAGGVLVRDPVLAGTPLVALRFGHGYDLAFCAVYVGLALLAWAWVLLGRDVLARRVGGRAVLVSALVWMVPPLFAPPLFTRDVFSYLAQGSMPLLGFDPYAGGPEVLAGPIAENVHWFWQETPAPYGPLFILIAKGIVWVTGPNMIAGVLLTRLVLLSGLVLFVAALPGLVRHLGGRVPVALWVAVANPVMVIHLVGGPHNDLLVIGLLASGSLLVLNRRHVAGIALVTMAMAIKATAGVALPFLVLVWAARLTGGQRARIARATAAGLAVFAPVFAMCTLAAGVGLGWLPALSAPSMIVNWLSLPTGAGELLHGAAQTLWSEAPKTPFITLTRVLGALALVVIGVRQWLAARDGGPDAVRRAGIVLLLVALLSPATLPWYYTWGMALLAMTAWTVRELQVVVLVSLFLIIAAFPNGEFALYYPGYLTVMGLGALVAAVSLNRRDPLRLRTSRRPVDARG